MIYKLNIFMMYKLTAKFYNSKENGFINMILIQASESVVISYKNKLEILWEEIQKTMTRSSNPYLIEIDDLNGDGKKEYFKIYQYSIDPFEMEKIEDTSGEFVSKIYMKVQNSLTKLLDMIIKTQKQQS